jgi:hypothetical protein
MNKKFRLFNLFLIAALFLGACNLPRNNPEDASATAAAQTVEALLSATPAFTATVTPTPIDTITPIPTGTVAASATPTCELARFITDVTIPDGTVMAPNQNFNKKWRIRNIGACAWNGYSLVFDSGDAMGAPATKPIPAVGPGQEIDLEIDFKAPATPGTYRSYWRIVTNANVLVPVVNGYQGRAFYVEIRVPAPATATNTSAPFAVTNVSFTNTGGCNGFTATASITTNGAGTVTYRFVRSDGAIDNNTYPALVFAAAGTQQSVGFTWTTSAPGTHWVDIYIITPNNQQFGRAQFTCP